ncbi:MAG: hypothetical protein NVS2B15_27500 [Pseudarthrobacter sp.]
MKTLLNIIWLVFGGFWLALGYFTAGIICCLLIVTIPWGIASFIGIPLAIANLKLIPVSLMPLGKQIVPTNTPFITAYRH